MLYSFEIEYFETIHLCDVRATYIMDLPQAQLNDVKLNPFVIDILNHPFIAAGIRRIANHRPVIVDNIDTYPFATVPNSATDVNCRYQQQPGLSNIRTFSFTIAADVPQGFNLSNTQLEFTCPRDYAFYEQLFMSGLLVQAPHIPNTTVAVANGNYYLWYVEGRVELLRVTNAQNPNSVELDSVAENGLLSRVRLTPVTKNSMRPIRLSDQLLMMIGFIGQRGNLFGLVDVDYFEGVLGGQGGFAMTVFLIKDSIGYSLAVQDVHSQYGCRLCKCFYMDELQASMWQHYHARITLENFQLAAISAFFNNMDFYCGVIRRLPQVVSAYISQNGVAVNRQQTITYVANHFGITTEEASRLMDSMHL